MYKTRHGWVGEMTHMDLCKKLKFDDANKWYMYNQESVLENEMHKLLWDFAIQRDHLISARRPDLVLINKKRELAELLILLSWLTTELNWKKTKKG